VTTTDDERQLKLLKHEEKDAVRRASGLADAFVEVVGAFAADWIGDHVQSEVKSQHAHTLSLGSDRLKELKADLAAVRQSTPAATKKALKGLPWAFREDVEPSPQHGMFAHSFSPMGRHSAGRPPDSVGHPLRLVLGQAGRILDAYGYAKLQDWKRSGGYRYPYGLDLSNEGNATLDAAAKADVEVIELRKQIRELERQIGQARAAAAWDEV